MSLRVSQLCKWCANCIYWAGDRTINAPLNSIEIKDMYVKGQCTNKYSFYLCSMYCNGTCSRFEKHPAVKY